MSYPRLETNESDFSLAVRQLVTDGFADTNCLIDLQPDGTQRLTKMALPFLVSRRGEILARVGQ